LQNLASIGGSWECKDDNGIHGISVITTTGFNESGGLKKITYQSVGFRIYQRNGEQERQGYLYTTDPGGRVLLDDYHLTIHFKIQIGTRPEIPPFDLDIRFDPTKQQWTGSWSLCDATAGAILERPHSREGVRANPLVGDWKGSQEPKVENLFTDTPEASSTLHIRQSADGKLIGWLDLFDDRTVPNLYQRYGEEVLFRSAEPNSVAIGLYDSVAVAHADYRYEGTLSADGITLTGKWRINGGGITTIGGGENQVPTVFRRIN
jgi:hypothetical protein